MGRGSASARPSTSSPARQGRTFPARFLGVSLQVTGEPQAAEGASAASAEGTQQSRHMLSMGSESVRLLQEIQPHRSLLILTYTAHHEDSPPPQAERGINVHQVHFQDSS